MSAMSAMSALHAMPDVSGIGDMNVCPICHEELDCEIGAITLPTCTHRMHAECYAGFMSYYVRRYHDTFDRTAENDISCPFCRKMMLRLEKRVGPVPLVFATTRDPEEVQQRVADRFCSVVIGACGVIWVLAYVHHLMFVYKGGDI
jgi:hypothetical protein